MTGGPAVRLPPPLIFAGGLIIGWALDSRLVDDGIYRHTRNPMYLGMALFYVAIALWLNSFWALLTLGPVLWVIQHYVIAREERYVAARFGADYVGYCHAVRRWL